MQFTKVVIALFVSAVMAQDTTGLPQCAIDCLNANVVNSACARTDITCLCADTTFHDNVQICVLTNCNSDEVQTTLLWTDAQCAAQPTATATATAAARRFRRN